MIFAQPPSHVFLWPTRAVGTNTIGTKSVFAQNRKCVVAEVGISIIERDRYEAVLGQSPINAIQAVLFRCTSIALGREPSDLAPEPIRVNDEAARHPGITRANPVIKQYRKTTHPLSLAP